MNNSLAIVGSGPEDIGRNVSHANRLAESLARDRRLDADALVAAALKHFENTYDYTSFDVYLTSGRAIDVSDVESLIADIRAQLSPLVRG
jgi:hypothetical protein